MIDEEKLMLQRLEKRINTESVSNEFLIELIQLSGTYLGLKTIPCYAKKYNMSYDGVKYHKKVIELLTVKYVIDNE